MGPGRTERGRELKSGNAHQQKIVLVPWTALSPTLLSTRGAATCRYFIMHGRWSQVTAAGEVRLQSPRDSLLLPLQPVGGVFFGIGIGSLTLHSFPCNRRVGAPLCLQDMEVTALTRVSAMAQGEGWTYTRIRGDLEREYSVRLPACGRCWGRFWRTETARAVPAPSNL